MEDAMKNAGTKYTDAQVNQLAQRHIDNSQVCGPKKVLFIWFSDIFQKNCSLFIPRYVVQNIWLSNILTIVNYLFQGMWSKNVKQSKMFSLFCWATYYLFPDEWSIKFFFYLIKRYLNYSHVCGPKEFNLSGLSTY